MPGRTREVSVAIHQGGRHQRLVDESRIHALFDQGPVIELLDHGAGDRVFQKIKHQGPVLALRFGGPAPSVHQHQSVQLVRMRQGVVPRHAAAHGIAGDDELRQGQPDRQSIHRRHELIGRGAVTRRSTGQTVARQVDGDDAIAVAEARSPRVPIGRRGGEAMHQQQHRASRIAFVAVMQCADRQADRHSANSASRIGFPAPRKEDRPGGALESPPPKSLRAPAPASRTLSPHPSHPSARFYFSDALPQTGQSGSADSFTVRASAARAS